VFKFTCLRSGIIFQCGLCRGSSSVSGELEVLNDLHFVFAAGETFTRQQLSQCKFDEERVCRVSLRVKLLLNDIYFIFSFFVFPIVDVQGRPKGVTTKFSLAPLVPRLSELLGIQVPFAFTMIQCQN